jgi:tetrahydromethanopterin S-methyltransferase subunit E
MGKPIGERIRRPSWWLDQALHTLAGAACCASVAVTLAYGLGLNPVVAAFAGMILSLIVDAVYEMTQNWGDAPEDGSAEDIGLDILFWQLGSVFGSLSVSAVGG